MPKIFDRENLLEFFEKLDSEVSAKVSIYVIGGAALAIAYDSKAGTTDIDTWKQESEVTEAYDRVLAKYPQLRLPMAPAKVNIDSPEMQSRFLPSSSLKLKKLKVLFPTAEDLFLLKAQRGDEKDVDDLISLNKTIALDADLILDRFKNELLPRYYGNNEVLVINYLFTVAAVFGGEVAKGHQQSIGS